jgi:DNA-binding transcriptional regulator YhcF (GntR family)
VITISIDNTSPVPPFEQLRGQVAENIRSGRFQPGARLPTVRQLAGDLGIAPNTVARAYKALEDEKLVQARGRHGTRVVDSSDLPKTRRADLLAEAAKRYVSEARRLGADIDEALEAARRAT